MIPSQNLPPGWRVMAPSEMPPIDKTPWWQQNPQRLEGQETEQLLVDGQPSTASRVWATLYAKGEERVVVFCLTYPTQEKADLELARFQNEGSGDGVDNLVGFSEREPHTIIVMSVPAESADRESFVAYFRSVTKSHP